MPSPAKQFSPSELAALEHAFAADPTSEAYRPLTEAYLAMGRFMEAMVVCKKGVKAHPSDPSAKVLLARVYADQGKDRKALEELQLALNAHPDHSLLNRMAGQLHMKLGQKEPGAAALRRAADAAPGDPEVQELLRKWGIPYTRGAKPSAPVAPRVAPPPASAARTTGARPAVPPARPPPAAPPHAAAPADLDDVDVSVDVPGRVRPKTERNVALAEQLAERYATQEFTLTGSQSIPVARRRSHGTLKTTLVLVAVGAAALVGYWFWTAKQKQRDIEIANDLKQARELLEKDTYKAYGDAAKLCEKILELDHDSIAGHAYLAYVDAILAGEHGEGPKREEAQIQLDAARRLAKEHSHVVAADAYLKFYAGEVQPAIDGLREALKGQPDVGFLNGVLGVILMQSGDLEEAKVSLDKARKFADRDARVSQMLGELYRRRGAEFQAQAAAAYDAALRISPDHVPTLLGSAMMLIGINRLDEAQKNVEKVIRAGDASPRQVALAEVIRASVLHAKGKQAEAAKAEQTGLGLDSTNPDIHAVIGERKMREKDFSGAAESFKRAIQGDPRRQVFYVELTQALMAKDGGAAQAVAELTAAAGRLPDDPRLQKLLGDAHLAAGNADGARKAYEAAVALAKPKKEGAEDKGYPEAHRALARLYRNQNDLAKAVGELDLARKEYQLADSLTAAEVELEAAQLELTRDPQGNGAVERYRKLLDRHPKYCAALWELGKLSYDRKMREEARKRLTSYVQECPRNPNVPEASKLIRTLY